MARPIRKKFEISIPKPQPKAEAPTIIKETPQYVVVNKTAGLIVEKSLNGFPSIENNVFQYLKATIKEPFLGIVHRLDRPVSGALLLAKKKSALKLFNEQFRESKTDKLYLAVVEKRPPSDFGDLKHYLRKIQEEKRAEILAKPAKDAVECHLTYRVLDENAYGALVEIKLLTGKFHQIRAQFAAIGCPVLGDAKYGGKKSYINDAIALHSYLLSFKDTITGENVTIHAPLPNHACWKRSEN
jgi:23S rRNA pseudouridine1911/1915/1917 synthase